MNSIFAQSLKDIIGNFIISDEESLGYGNLYWRIVRPAEQNDIGPVHRDAWFWEINDEYGMDREEYNKRVKIWISIVTENGKNGLMVEKYSHKRKDIKWEGEMRYGLKKPVLLTEEKELKMRLLKTNPGDAIIFDDELLHGGHINNGEKTRVSMEFTALVIKN